MPAVDWAAAEDALYRLSGEQLARFLAGPAAQRVYALGFFYDPEAGDVYPVANTMDHHTRGYTARVKEFGPADEYQHLWDSGNWEFPAGLFPSTSAEFAAFDKGWAPYREAVAASDEPDRATRLADVCVAVLKRLVADGLPARVPNLMGYVVQSPLDSADEVAANQAKVTAAVTGGAPND